MQHRVLSIGDDVFVEMMEVQSDIRMPNIMDHDACLFYVIEGASEVYSPTEKVVMNKSDSVLMKCGHYIGCSIGAGPSQPYQSVGFHFPPGIVGEFVKEGRIKLDAATPRAEVSAIRLTANRRLDNYVDGMLYYLEHPEEATDEFLKVKMHELLTILIQSGQAEPLLADVLSRLYSPQQIAFNEVIEANLYTRLKYS